MGPFCWHVIPQIQFEKELFDSATRIFVLLVLQLKFVIVSRQILSILAGQQSISC